MTNGASVRLVGSVVESPGKGQMREFVVEDAKLLGECDPEVSCMRDVIELNLWQFTALSHPKEGIDK